MLRLELETFMIVINSRRGVWFRDLGSGDLLKLRGNLTLEEDFARD